MSGGFEEPETLKDLLKGGDVFIKVVPLGRIVTNAIKPSVADKTARDALDPEAILISPVVDGPESRDSSDLYGGVFEKAKVQDVLIRSHMIKQNLCSFLGQHRL